MQIKSTKSLDNNCEKCKPNLHGYRNMHGILVSIASREILTSYGFQFPVQNIHKHSPEISWPEFVWRLPRSALFSNLKLKFLWSRTLRASFVIGGSCNHYGSFWITQCIVSTRTVMTKICAEILISVKVSTSLRTWTYTYRVARIARADLFWNTAYTCNTHNVAQARMEILVWHLKICTESPLVSIWGFYYTLSVMFRDTYSDYQPGSEGDDYNDAIRKIAESGWTTFPAWGFLNASNIIMVFSSQELPKNILV